MTNYCRECGKPIPKNYNGGPALRCSECRAGKDEELANMLGEKSDIEEENDYLSKRFFDIENEYMKLNYQYHKLTKRYNVLRARHTEILKENKKLRNQNEKYGKGIERLFGRNYKLEEILSSKGNKDE